MSVCLFVPFHAIFFEASHWPSDHMTRSRPLIGQPSFPTIWWWWGEGRHGREIFSTQGNCQVNYFSKKVVKAIVKSIVQPKMFFKVIVKSILFPKTLSRQLSSQLCYQKESSRQLSSQLFDGNYLIFFYVSYCVF